MIKKRIAVIFGGMSSEHEVSLMSAASVLGNFPTEKYEAVPIGITKDGRWLFFPGNYSDIPGGEWENNPGCVSAVISPDRSAGGLLMTSPDGRSYTRSVDAIFPVLHGKFGEDGTIQGLSALAGIPCVGAGVLSSAVCMDKEIANLLFDISGIPHARWRVIHSRDIDLIDEYTGEWEQNIGYPMFVKPANSGSSVGVSKARDRDSLKHAVELAFKHDNKVIVEKAILGKELECAVLGNDSPFASCASEILPVNDFYDYDAKYLTPSKTVLPADIHPDLSEKLQNTAVKAYRLLDCSGMARVDFLYETASDTLYINEINTIPGFTAISMYAKMMDASGISYPVLVEKLIELAIEKSTGRY